MKTQTLLHVFAMAAATATALMRPKIQPPYATTPRRLASRAGSGPLGYLSVDDHDYTSSQKFASAAAATTVLVSADGGVFTACLPFATGATVEDCTAVLGYVGAQNGTVAVAEGKCMNWWEGTCKAQVCSREGELRETGSWVAETLRGDALGICVAKGNSAAVADCPDYGDACGKYRMYLVGMDG